jgi:hypothetical protein
MQESGDEISPHPLHGLPLTTEGLRARSCQHAVHPHHADCRVGPLRERSRAPISVL